MNSEDQAAWDWFFAAATILVGFRDAERHVDYGNARLLKKAEDLTEAMMLRRAARHLRLERERAEKQQPGRIDPPRDIYTGDPLRQETTTGG